MYDGNKPGAYNTAMNDIKAWLRRQVHYFIDTLIPTYYFRYASGFLHILAYICRGSTAIFAVIVLANTHWLA
jgi:hypothetical protein